MPAGQETHSPETAPLVTPSPNAQSMHTVLPKPGVYQPTAQSRHDSGDTEYVPGTQEMQMEPPVTFEKEPAPQRVQVLNPRPVET